jgi:hypothetical protein
MGRRRQLIIGLILLIGGLVVVAIGTIFPSSNPLVALGWLLLVPSLVSFCGTIFVFVSLAGIVSQVPDSLAGLNGAFVPGPAPGLSAFVIDGIGLSVGLVLGAVAALTWWAFRARHLPSR